MKEKVKHLEYMYDEYDKQIRRIVPVYEEMNREILRNITFRERAKLNILDLGIGASYLSFKLLQKFPDSFLDGLDYEEKMIQKSKERISILTKNFSLFHQNMKNFKFNKKYDIVVSVLAIHHLTDSEKQNFFLKIYKNLNKDGYFIIGDAFHLIPESKNKEMLKWWENHLKNVLGDKEGEQFFQDTLKYDMYSKKEDQLNWMKESGFSEVNFVWKKYNYAVLVAKK